MDPVRSNISTSLLAWSNDVIVTSFVPSHVQLNVKKMSLNLGVNSRSCRDRVLSGINKMKNAMFIFLGLDETKRVSCLHHFLQTCCSGSSVIS